jgi:hypothetical protein
MAKPRIPRGYANRHTMVRKARGVARDRPCEECGGRAAHWSTIRGRDGLKPEDYRALCIPCHWRYDGRDQPLGKPNNSAKLTERQVMVIWNRRAEGSRALAREFGMSQQGVSGIVNGWAWRWLTGAPEPARGARGGPGARKRRTVRKDDFAARPGRPAGETHHSAKLTEDQVREIRSRISETGASLAREFGVTQSLVSGIRTGKTWKEAGGPVARPQPRRAVLSAEPGQRFGKLVVSGPVITREVGGKRRKAVHCICDCGTRVVVDLERLLGGNTKSCGCLRKEAGQKNRRLTVEAGQRFGRGVVLEPDLRLDDGRRAARLRCDCGGEYVSVIYPLLKGVTVSCGCRSRETLDLGRRERNGNALSREDVG